MNNKDKLIELLKTDEAVKKDMEELKFGCELIVLETKEHEYCKVVKWGIIKVWTMQYEIFNKLGIFKIIWTLEERHLRMYCISNWINLITNWYWETQTQIRQPVYISNNTLSFNNQTEEVYRAIVEFLTKELWKN